ncbi:MAG TPA: trehalose-phosphatase [Steroidobacteraceae bacterium]|nr:trehalose-phosphatase [Steroidobacteraceae bacterium]
MNGPPGAAAAPGSGRAATPPLPAPQACALFLDFDGTLAHFAARPHEVVVDPELRALLVGLHAATGGATAVVSGRSIADLDRMLEPLRLPLSGLHGVERRRADGSVQRMQLPAAAVARVRAGLRAVARGHAGLYVEDKGAAFAVHYRGVDVALGPLRQALQELAADSGGVFELQPGAEVLELKAAGLDKGRAVESFMQEPPFLGRRALFLGDDPGDAHGFAAAARAGGFGVAVGSRVAAHWRLADPQAVRRWLATLVGTDGWTARPT